MATVHEMAVLARCTRNGRVIWHHVAEQLGESEPDVRAKHDPTYLREGPLPRATVPEPPPVPKKYASMTYITAMVVSLAEIGKPAGEAVGLEFGVAVECAGHA